MRCAALVSAAAAVVFAAHAASAQESPPPLPHFVVDLQGVVPVFPNDAQQLADSRLVVSQNRALTVTELPGAGFGGRLGAHVYVFKWKAITLGVGGEAFIGSSSNSPSSPTIIGADGGTYPAVAVSERLTSVAPQLSFNFGTGRGWSYLSGGVGRSRWSVRPAGQAAAAADTELLPTTNYGGGARWFIKRHLAFSLDIRIYEIQPGSVSAIGPGSPRTRLLTFGAGISLK